jgi:hypothetical protein
MTNEELWQTLGRIEAYGKANYDLVSDHIKEDLRVHSDLEDRMRIQEKSRWTAMGAICLVAAIGGWGLFV